MICPYCQGIGRKEIDGLRLRDQLRNARRHLGMTLAEVSELVGTTKSTILSYEAGKVRNPSFPVLMRLGVLYGVAPCEWSERV